MIIPTSAPKELLNKKHKKFILKYASERDSYVKKNLYLNIIFISLKFIFEYNILGIYYD